MVPNSKDALKKVEDDFLRLKPLIKHFNHRPEFS